MNTIKNSLIIFAFLITVQLFSAEKKVDQFLYHDITKNTEDACRKVFSIDSLNKEIGSYLNPQEIKDDFYQALGGDKYTDIYDYKKLQDTAALGLLYQQINQYDQNLLVAITARSARKNTWFSAAIEERDVDFVKFFLQYGIDVYAEDVNRCTVFTRACYDGVDAIVKLLINHGFDVNRRKRPSKSKEYVFDEKESTPLHIALEYKRSPGVIKLLLDHGADMYATTEGLTALHAGITFSRVSIENLQLFLDHGFNAKHLDKYGQTIIHNALGGQEALLKYLLDHDGIHSLNIQDLNGKTPLHTAAFYLYVDSVKMLLQYNPDITLQDVDGKTALQLLSRKYLPVYSGRRDFARKKAILTCLKEYKKLKKAEV